MRLDADACYPALVARDARFDGVFFVGVTTTGIYCRPICTAKLPGRERCRFFGTAAAAEADGFRACFRCRPERAPGSSSIDSVSRVVALGMRRIEAGALDVGTLDALAAELGVSARHLRRAMRRELGVTPVAVAEARRLALARQLLVETSLPMAEVAFASGFGSVRRFNTLVRERCGRSPTALRDGGRAARAAHVGRGAGRAVPRPPHRGTAGTETLSVLLDYRPPLDFGALLDFLAARAIPGVEAVVRGRYFRTLRVGERRGVVSVAPVPGRAALRAEVSLSLAGALVQVVAILRRIFDLDAHPTVVDGRLSQDPLLAPLVRGRPGLRIPGAASGFEVATRALLGQQVSVAAASTLHGRVAATYGEALETPFPALTRLTPEPARLATAAATELGALGVTQRRAEALVNMATEVVENRLSLETALDEERFIAALTRLPGVGPWTAHYVALRALPWPDAFPEADLGLVRAAGATSPRALRARAERWRPFRGYAALHLWSSLTPPPRAAVPLRGDTP